MALNASPGIYAGGMSDGWTNLVVTNQNPSVILSPLLHLNLFIEGYLRGE
ncbi:MAG: hypothetical protein IPN36_11665 [Bacteroidetes bacterium]|nr:hypothetical protein [Bacteroidota bacterium]